MNVDVQINFGGDILPPSKAVRKSSEGCQSQADYYTPKNTGSTLTNIYQRPGRKMYYCAKRKYHKNLNSKKIAISKSPSKKKKKTGANSSITSPMRYSFNYPSKPTDPPTSSKCFDCTDYTGHPKAKSYSVCSYNPRKGKKGSITSRNSINSKTSRNSRNSMNSLLDSMSTVSSLISSISLNMGKWEEVNKRVKECVKGEEIGEEEEELEDFKIEGEFEIEEELEGIEEGDIEEVEVDVCVTKDDRDEKMIEEVGSEINPFLTIGRCSEGYSKPIRKAPKISKKLTVNYNKKAKKKNKKGLTLTDSHLTRVLHKTKTGKEDIDFYPLASELDQPRTTKALRVKRSSFSGYKKISNSKNGNKPKSRIGKDNLRYSAKRGRNDTVIERNPDTYLFSKYSSRKTKILNSSINYSAIDLVTRMSNHTSEGPHTRKVKKKMKKQLQSSTARKTTSQGRKGMLTNKS